MQTPTDDPVYFKRLHPEAIIPIRATPTSAGFDLFSIENVTIYGGYGSKLVSTGIAVALPPGTYGRIAMRSGLAVKLHLAVSAGVIDSDYRGKIKVVVYTTKVYDNCTNRPGNNICQISKGEKFAQLVVERINSHQGMEVAELPKSETEHLGFGSTGQFISGKDETTEKVVPKHVETVEKAVPKHVESKFRPMEIESSPCYIKEVYDFQHEADFKRLMDESNNHLH